VVLPAPSKTLSMLDKGLSLLGSRGILRRRWQHTSQLASRMFVCCPFHVWASTMRINFSLDLRLLRNRLALDATILAEPSWFEWTVYGAQWLPFPMTHADLVIHARWTDLADVRPPTHDS